MPREPNRLMEIRGLMGSIGEQLGLAWTAEQDTQRIRATKRYREIEHQVMIQRAVAELSGHYTLGAGHSLANLVLRILLLNDNAAASLNSRYGDADGFQPGNDSQQSWKTFNKGLLKGLADAGVASSNGYMVQLVNSMHSLFNEDEFQALNLRRGMDYHRRRPQSVAHGSRRTGAIQVGAELTGTVRLAEVEVESNANRVHDVALGAMLKLRETMSNVRILHVRAIRAEGLYYPQAKRPHYSGGRKIRA